MDSGNSGSLQSSSGEARDNNDQEFDSRAESISSLLNPHNFSSINQPPFLSHQNPNFFDPQNLDHVTQYSNNNDLIWSRGLQLQSQSQSDHNYSNLGNLSGPQSIPPGPSFSDSRAAAAPQLPKNPKKRTRASRRAPTTVLTTDTTNFRQMVQEFTGIPAAPFSGSPYSRRLDLFSAASALRSGGHLDTLGPLCPLRPSAHKTISPFSSSPPLLNSTMIDSIAPPSTTIGGASSSNNPHGFQLTTDQLMNLHSIQQQNFGFMGRADGGEMRSNDERWKSGESNDGVQENMGGFDGNTQNLSGYNLNLAEKGMENLAAPPAASSAEPTASASWICPSN